jgi:serine phosphatase RsbU (regulator of sigma subunit)
MNRSQQICAAMGSATSSGTAGALVATSVQTVVETCWNSRHQPAQILRKANDILWDVQDGDWRSSLCYLQIHPASGATQLALAGDLQVFVFSSRGVRTVGGTTTKLAEQPDTRFFNEQINLEGGDLLIVASASLLQGERDGGLTQSRFFKHINSMLDESVSDIVDQIARMLPMDSSSDSEEHAAPLLDRSLLAIRRRF